MRAIADIARDAGLDLRPSGQGRFVARCPFHDDRNPSFSIYTSRDGKERYHCFGCGARGDAIDFLRAMRGLSFAEARRELGEPAGHASYPSARSVAEKGRARLIDQAREERRIELLRALARACRICWQISRSIKTPEDLDHAAPFLLVRDFLEDRHEALRVGSREEQDEVINEWNGVCVHGEFFFLRNRT